ncbi:MAG: hypothetical protein H6548_03425 [Chitinophagales bacterium]|nr:hypothetical protein [Chitinophagales bacterium]HAE13873.1 hypothetical protein [Bacteroidota bacterium]MCB9019630.1 hypothetical protein [Chitinophagales bacterium]MCB9021146.1 hypothetical protein [Chitinophagales bacterium]HAE34204.1 hypothetical protein [Bacteroidota bacterium]
MLQTFLLMMGLLCNPQPQACDIIASTYAEGVTWEFVVNDDKGAMYKTYQYKVDEIYDEEERMVYAIRYVTLNKKGKEEDKGNRNIITAGDLYLVNAETMIPDYKSDKPTNISLPCSPNPGDAVGDVRKVSTYTVENLGQKSYISNKINITDGKYGNRETITTPLGELDCIVLNYTVSLDLQEFTYKDWIDADLRTVKREIYDKKGKLAFTGMMTSYNKP